jgi:hypothetical protein
MEVTRDLDDEARLAKKIVGGRDSLVSTLIARDVGNDKLLAFFVHAPRRDQSYGHESRDGRGSTGRPHYL